MTDPRISVIIPAYNEEKYLPRLLAGVAAARARYRQGAEAVEVIVADNASTDATSEVASTRGCRVVPVAKRVIAAARNAGAREARGEIFAFVDADFQIHPETFNAIEASLAEGKAVVGATGVKMERRSLGIGVSYALLAPLAILLGMDTGVVYCRRGDFEAVGGYNEARLVAEDVQLLRDLKRLGRGRGQKFERLSGVKAIASTRKFDRFGDWHYVTGMLPLAYAALFSRPMLERWIRSYFYEDPR
jgi:glycosyltransferase involved in cell wall biosynthesis